MSGENRIQPSSKRCPSCDKVGYVYRSHSRNIFEKAVKTFNIFAVYRCHSCGWRGIKIKRTRLKKYFSLKVISLFVLSMLVVYFLVSYILKQYFQLTYFN